jgi:carboxylesterase
VRAIAALATALWLPRPAERFARLTQRIPLVRRASLPKIAGSDLRDRLMRARNHVAQGRSGMPLNALASLVDFGHHVRGILGEVRVPALLMHSRGDHTVPFECLDALAQGLSSREIKRVALERSFHVLPLDVEREQVFRAVAEHMMTHLNA